MYRRGIEWWLVTNSQTGRDEKAIFSRSASSEEEKEEVKEEKEEEEQELEEIDLAVDRVGAGSLTRANSRVTDREGERVIGDAQK